MPYSTLWLIVLGAAASLAPACGDDEPTFVPTPALVTGIAPAGFPEGSVVKTAPADNPLTEEKAQLGKRLFFDQRLSRTERVSCGTCHQPAHAFAEPRALSLGVDEREGTRNAPALINLAWAITFFWDGRVKSLEEQVGKPIENPVEMDLPLGDAVARLNGDARYVQAFTAAFGGPPTEQSMRQALASFLRTLISGASPYDRYLAGEVDALDVSALRGHDVFFGPRGRCFHCHPAGALTNDGFFNNGSYVEGAADAGRQLVTGRTGDLGKFKVPGLRNIAETAPYMHDGSVATLEEVVAHYDAGGRGGPGTDPQIAALALTAQESDDLVNFMRALSDPVFRSDPRFRP